MSLDRAATEVMKALSDCLSREIGYQTQLNQNMEDLENRKRALIAKRDDIEAKVNYDKLQGRSALNEVSNWLQDVETVKGKVSDIQKNFEEQKSGWKGLFPNYCERRKISMESSILIGQMEKLITDGNFENGVTIERPTMPIVGNALPMMPIERPTMPIVGNALPMMPIENLVKDVAKECCNLPSAIITAAVENAAVWKDALKEASGEFKGIRKVFKQHLG